jgi:hypothetical protein
MFMLRRLGIATALALTATAAPSIPVNATTTAVSGTMVFDAETTCPDPPDGYADFVDYTVVVTGDLDGCWYTDIGRGRNFGPPTGLYFEVGREVFVGSVRGGPEGTFSTTYTWESQWDPDVDTGTEIWGRCQHLIVRGSGTGGLQGASGFLARTDIAPDASVGRYRGVVRQP